MRRRPRILTAAAVAVWVAAGSAACDGPRGEHTTVLDLVKAETPAAAADVGRSSLPFIEARPLVEARVATGAATFSVLARGPRLTKAPCASCHTEPLAAMRWRGSDGQKTAHWQIELVHASSAVMTCTTCHAPADLDGLRTLTGTLVPFDHAYEVCAQCHSNQKADWEGGAHGKRAGGWAPPRVVYNCTECHNPHAPAFETRWPAHAGRDPVTGE